MQFSRSNTLQPVAGQNQYALKDRKFLNPSNLLIAGLKNWKQAQKNEDLKNSAICIIDFYIENKLQNQLVFIA